MTIVAQPCEASVELATVGELDEAQFQGFYFSKPMAARDVPAWIRGRSASD